MIKQDTIASVIEAANIVEVITDFVGLKKKGANFQAPCPFHNEKTASFVVSPVKGIYKCFGCGKGGDSVSFVIEHEKFSYLEAIRYLAAKYNITVEEEEKTDQQKIASISRETILKLNSIATEHFIENLHNTPEALSYLLQERQLSQETINIFQIGYAKPDYRTLSNKLSSLKYPAAKIIDADLAFDREGKMLDKFRDRITFPIHSITGKVIGYSARILTDNPNLPKYVNTKETEIYHKREALYGLFITKKAIVEADNCYLVEGNVDVVSVYDKGIHNITASSGTALTHEQVKGIKRFTKNLTILYDGDKAGKIATGKGLEIAVEEQMNVKAVIFPDGDDPDSYLKTHGAGKFKQFIEANKGDLIDFYYSGWNDLLPQAKDDTVTVILSLLSKINQQDLHQLQFFTTKVSRLLGLSLSAIQQKIDQFRGSINQTVETQELQQEKNIASNHEMEFAKALVLYGNRQYNTECLCYFFMMEKGGLPEDFKEGVPLKIFQAYYEQLIEGSVPDHDFFLNHEDTEIADFAQQLVFEETPTSKSWTEGRTAEKSSYTDIVTNVVSYYRVFKLKALILENQTMMLTATEETIDEIMGEDLKLKQILSRECKQLGIHMI